MTSPYTRFIVLGQGRSGTTMLVQALNSLPAVVCFGEIFNASTPGIEYGVEGYKSTADDIALRKRDLAGFLRTRIFARHDEGVAAVGFKFGYSHFWQHEGLVEILAEDRELKVVHLCRVNRLRAYVSLKIAEETGQWFEYAPEPAFRSRLNLRTLAKAMRDPLRAAKAVVRKLVGMQRTPVANQRPDAVSDLKHRGLTIDPEQFAEYCRRGEFSERKWREIFEDHESLELTYEDLVANRDGELAGIQRFLGLEPSTSSILLRKQNPEPLRQLVANYDELREAFVGSDYEVFFDD